MSLREPNFETWALIHRGTLSREECGVGVVHDVSYHLIESLLENGDLADSMEGEFLHITHFNNTWDTFDGVAQFVVENIFADELEITGWGYTMRLVYLEDHEAKYYEF